MLPAVRSSRTVSLALAALTLASFVRADDVDGRITTAVELRTTTYREAQTDVRAPTVAVALALPDGTRLRGHYLADVITSASVSVDVVASASIPLDRDVDATFREVRHEVALGGSRVFGDASRQGALAADVRASREPDYRSVTVALDGELRLHASRTVVGLGLVYGHDELRVAVHDVEQPTRVLRVESPGPVDDFDALVVATRLRHVVHPRLVLGGGYELGYATGLLGSPYRRVSVDGRIAVEALPGRRLRHTVSLVAVRASRGGRAAVHGELRGYVDDFGVRALTLEGRVHTQLLPAMRLRLRSRLYAQTAADFAAPYDVTVPAYYDAPRHTTSNPRYQAQRALEAGLSTTLALAPLVRDGHPLARLELELGFDARLSTTRFGHAATSYFAVRAPLP